MKEFDSLWPLLGLDHAKLLVAFKSLARLVFRMKIERLWEGQCRCWRPRSPRWLQANGHCSTSTASLHLWKETHLLPTVTNDRVSLHRTPLCRVSYIEFLNIEFLSHNIQRSVMLYAGTRERLASRNITNCSEKTSQRRRYRGLVHGMYKYNQGLQPDSYLFILMLTHLYRYSVRLHWAIFHRLTHRLLFRAPPSTD